MQGYTNVFLSPSFIAKYFKYSDDTAILSLLTDRDSVTTYQQSAAHFTQWVTKAKQLTFNSCNKFTNPHSATFINGQAVEMVERFKYLSIILDMVDVSASTPG